MNNVRRYSVKYLILSSLLFMLFFAGVKYKNSESIHPDVRTLYETSKAVLVEIRNEGGRFQLYRDGIPYFIKGAVHWSDPTGLIPLKSIAESGGNSVRSGGEYLQKILDEAKRLDMTVLVSLDIGMEKVDNFNYDDPVAVKNQYDKIEIIVRKLKDHPALLMWGIGNELGVKGYKNLKVWDAVNDIAEMIHRLDVNHPTLTVVGQEFTLDGSIQEIIRRCPALDLLGVNFYKNIESVQVKLREFGWQKPYVITEWGPTGHWQVAKTLWKAAIEETSTEKAVCFRERYYSAILNDRQMCLGSYAFFWDQKQERTPTWYGMFLKSGERTEAVDIMQFLWSGTWPSNRAPQISSFRIDNKSSSDNVTLGKGSFNLAVVTAADPNGDTLEYRWEILPEQPLAGYAGSGEKELPPVPGLFRETSSPTLSFVTPDHHGPYRLFIYISDGKGSAATANIPFNVDE